MYGAKKFDFKNINFKILSIILVIVLGIFSIYVAFGRNKNNNNIFCEREFYVLYLEKNKKQTGLISIQEMVKKLGAGGDIIFENGYYYLTACVYLNKDDSTQILKNITNSYNDSGVLNLKRKKVTSKNRFLIKSEVEIYNYLVFLDKFLTELSENELLYLSGKITQKQFIAFVMNSKIEINAYKNHIDSLAESEFYQMIRTYQSLFLLYIDNFLSNIFESSIKNSLVCSLTVNFFVTYYDFYNNL